MNYWNIIKQYDDEDKAIKATLRTMLITGEEFGPVAERIIANTPAGHVAPKLETLLRKLAQASLNRR